MVDKGRRAEGVNWKDLRQQIQARLWGALGGPYRPLDQLLIAMLHANEPTQKYRVNVFLIEEENGPAVRVYVDALGRMGGIFAGMATWNVKTFMELGQGELLKMVRAALKKIQDNIAVVEGAK